MKTIKALLNLFFLYFINNTEVISQIITILNESTKEPLENVALFNASRNYSILSDVFGKTNITNFKENDSIFFQHPSYNGLVFTKQELIHLGEDNESEATVYSSPSCCTLNLQTTFKINKSFRMQFAVENIPDTFY